MAFLSDGPKAVSVLFGIKGDQFGMKISTCGDHVDVCFLYHGPESCPTRGLHLSKENKDMAKLVFCNGSLLEYPGRQVQDSHAEGFVDRCIDQGQGAIRLAPRWAAREFCDPGPWIRKRLSLLSLSPHALKVLSRPFRNDEWWGLCCIEIATGSQLVTGGAPFREGQSHAFDGECLMSFQQMIEAAPSLILGRDIADKSRTRFGKPTPLIVSKRFVNEGPIPFHFHFGTDPDAKPEIHDVISQDNPHILANHSLTHAIGLQPWMTQDDFIACMERWGQPEGNGILEWAQWQRIPVGTGTFKCPPLLLHAPGAVATHEVHWPVDQHGLVQDWMPECRLTPDQAFAAAPKSVYPEGRARNDWEYLASLLDFDLNWRTDIMRALFSPNAVANQYCSDGVHAFWSGHGKMPGELNTAILRLELQPGAKTTLKGLPGTGFFFLSAGKGKVAGLDCRLEQGIEFDGSVPSECGWLTSQLINDGVPVENTGSEPFVLTIDFQQEVHLN